MSVFFSIEEVTHRLEIEHLYAQYVHSADAGDIDGLDGIFDLDAVLDYTSTGAPLQTYAEVREGDLFRGRLFWKVFHFYTNFLISFDDDFSTAKVTMKVLCPVAASDGAGAPLFDMLGMYDDALTQRADGWRLTHRVWNPGWIATGQQIQGPPPNLS